MNVGCSTYWPALELGPAALRCAEQMNKEVRKEKGNVEKI